MDKDKESTQIPGQLTINGEMEHHKGVVRSPQGAVLARSLVISLIPITDGIAVQVPAEVLAHVHRIIDGVAHINLQVPLRIDSREHNRF